jgi:CDP-diacylglycerol--serine O-phosphatidyltransferase
LNQRLGPNFDAIDGEEQRRPIIGVALLPSAATLGNLLCGFVAVFFCLLAMRDTYFTHVSATPIPRFTNEHLREFFPSYIAIGGYLIVAAMIFDALDGRLARIARRTSEFGAQLDSIADIVSFGVAPAMLFITILLTLSVPPEGSAAASKIQWRIGMSCSLVFVACAAIRLARYNAENVKDESGQRRFLGLPTPGAAAALVSLIFLHEDIAYSGPGPASIWANSLRWVIAPVAFCLGMLMISRIENVHIFNVYFRREHPPVHLVWILVALGIWWFSPQILMVALAYTYVFSGILLNAQRWRRRRRAGTIRSAPPKAPVGSN